MKKFLLLLTAILLGNITFAFEIVYPKQNNTIINAPSTFFIGSSKTPLKINGNNVPIHPSGGFAYVVNLKQGKNTFIIESEKEKQVFNIVKPQYKNTCTPSFEFIPYKNKKNLLVNIENTPLRSTPVDGGINRIAHLPENFPLTSDGEKQGFYRIILGEKIGWISKNAVKISSEDYTLPAELKGYDYIDSDEYFTFVFHLNKQVPYEITEGEGLQLKIYNVKDRPENTYIMDFPVKDALSGRKLIGYSGKYDGNNFIWQIRKPIITNKQKPLKGIKIAIDAGHGGNETGAVGCLRDKEKDITLSVAKYLETELKKRGAEVIMSSKGDVNPNLYERVKTANDNNAVVLISIHANALPDGCDPNKNSGTSVYYYYNQAKPLAEIILQTMTSQLHTNNDKVRQASFAVVRNTEALSILIETAYLINPSDNAKLINDEFRKSCAKSIADGLEKYFKN